ncbi:unnamed protein product [Amoebophrya sp. A120]|nr:unnamed protein product [Amoebophrya sp. A120]|eukprot:GSA120T00020377001.1
MTVVYGVLDEAAKTSGLVLTKDAACSTSTTTSSAASTNKTAKNYTTSTTPTAPTTHTTPPQLLDWCATAATFLGHIAHRETPTNAAAAAAEAHGEPPGLGDFLCQYVEEKERRKVKRQLEKNYSTQNVLVQELRRRDGHDLQAAASLQAEASVVLGVAANIEQGSRAEALGVRTHCSEEQEPSAPSPTCSSSAASSTAGVEISRPSSLQGILKKDSSGEQHHLPGAWFTTTIPGKREQKLYQDPRKVSAQQEHHFSAFDVVPAEAEIVGAPVVEDANGRTSRTDTGTPAPAVLAGQQVEHHSEDKKSDVKNASSSEQGPLVDVLSQKILLNEPAALRSMLEYLNKPLVVLDLDEAFLFPILDEAEDDGIQDQGIALLNVENENQEGNASCTTTRESNTNSRRVPSRTCHQELISQFKRNVLALKRFQATGAAATTTVLPVSAENPSVVAKKFEEGYKRLAGVEQRGADVELLAKNYLDDKENVDEDQATSALDVVDHRESSSDIKNSSYNNFYDPKTSPGIYVNGAYVQGFGGRVIKEFALRDMKDIKSRSSPPVEQAQASSSSRGAGGAAPAAAGPLYHATRWTSSSATLQQPPPGLMIAGAWTYAAVAARSSRSTQERHQLGFVEQGQEQHALQVDGFSVLLRFAEEKVFTAEGRAEFGENIKLHFTSRKETYALAAQESKMRKTKSVEVENKKSRLSKMKKRTNMFLDEAPGPAAAVDSASLLKRELEEFAKKLREQEGAPLKNIKASATSTSKSKTDEAAKRKTTCTYDVDPVVFYDAETLLRKVDNNELAPALRADWVWPNMPVQRGPTVSSMTSVPLVDEEAAAELQVQHAMRMNDVERWNIKITRAQLRLQAALTSYLEENYAGSFKYNWEICTSDTSQSCYGGSSDCTSSRGPTSVLRMTLPNVSKAAAVERFLEDDEVRRMLNLRSFKDLLFKKMALNAAAAAGYPSKYLSAASGAGAGGPVQLSLPDEQEPASAVVFPGLYLKDNAKTRRLAKHRELEELKHDVRTKVAVFAGSTRSSPLVAPSSSRTATQEKETTPHGTGGPSPTAASTTTSTASQAVSPTTSTQNPKTLFEKLPRSKAQAGIRIGRKNACQELYGYANVQAELSEVLNVIRAVSKLHRLLHQDAGVLRLEKELDEVDKKILGKFADLLGKLKIMTSTSSGGGSCTSRSTSTTSTADISSFSFEDVLSSERSDDFAGSSCCSAEGLSAPWKEVVAKAVAALPVVQQNRFLGDI